MLCPLTNAPISFKLSVREFGQIAYISVLHIGVKGSLSHFKKVIWHPSSSHLRPFPLLVFRAMLDGGSSITHFVFFVTKRPVPGSQAVLLRWKSDSVAWKNRRQ